jgi:hypothetical protein
MPNGNPVEAAKAAYEAARGAAQAVTFNPGATDEEKAAARSSRDRMLAAYSEEIINEAAQRTALLTSLIAELQTLIGSLQSPGLGDAIGTLNEAVTTVNTALESDS